MKRQLNKRFWIESAVALANAALLLLSAFWPDWIEIVLHVHPDASPGLAEWGIVALALSLTLMFAVLARSEWRKALQVA